MKAIVCEMCNSNDIVKEDGIYVCKNCGTKYSVEEAKKLMIDGTVDVSGSTVKVDVSDRIENLYEMARRENQKFNGDALKYYEEIVIERPNDWEANFYVEYYKATNATLGEASSVLLRMIGIVKDCFELVKKYEKEEDYLDIYTDICNRCNILAIMWRGTAETSYKSLGEVGKKKYVDIASMSYSLSKSVADYIISYFDDKETGLEIYKRIVENIKSGWLGYVFVDAHAKGIIETIKKYEPDYMPPTMPSNNGCYVATAVYGSYDCPQVWTLRRYRDYTLAETWYGRAFIHTYYAISPTIVKLFGDTKWFKHMWRGKLDRMVARLNESGVENTPYEDKNW